MAGEEGEGQLKLFKMDPPQNFLCKEVCQGEMEGIGGRGSCCSQYYVQRPKTRFYRGLGTIPIFRAKRGMDSKRGTSSEVVSVRKRMVPGWVDRKAGATRHSPFLVLSPFYGSKGRGQMETNNRSFKVKQKDHEKVLQNGGLKEDLQDNPSRSLGRQIGPQRCVPSHSLSQRNLEIFPVCNSDRWQNRGFLFQGSTLRPYNSSLGILEGVKTHQERTEIARHNNHILPGRFFYPSSFQTGSTRSNTDSDRCTPKIWLQHKLGENVTGTSQSFGLSRCYPGSGKPNFFSPKGKGEQNPGILYNGQESPVSHPKGFGKVSGISELRSPVSKIRKALSETHPSLDGEEYFSLEQRPKSSLKQGVAGSVSSLGRPRLFVDSDSYEAKSVQHDVNDRCIRRCMGRNSSATKGDSSLADRMAGHVYELEGAESYPYVHSSFPREAARAVCQGSVRQYDSPSLFEERRISGFRSSMVSLHGASDLCSRARDLFSSSSLERKVECSSRSSFQKQADQHRVEVRSPFLQEVLSSIGRTPNRPVCNNREYSTPSLYLTLSRRESGGLRCSESGLEQVVFSLPFSSCSVVRGNSGSSQEVYRQRISDSSILANSNLVFRAGEEMPFQIPPSRGSLPVPGEGRGNVLSQVPFCFQASCMDIIKDSVIRKGLTEEAAIILNYMHRESTKRQYQSVWHKFLEYLSLMNINHSSVSVYIVINFLAFHANRFDRAYSTIAVYKNALRYPLWYGIKVDIDTREMSDFMRGMFGWKPKPKSTRLPKWDLNQLLEWFTSEEFWPPERCAPFRLLQKTLVLIMLSSGRRIHEIAALTDNYRREKDKKTITLFWPEGFKSKNYSRDFIPKDPTIRKMSHWINTERDLRNCPVYNWEIYRNRKFEWDAPSNGKLWDRDYKDLVIAFKSVVWECQNKFMAHKGDVEICPHQTKKWACSLSAMYWLDAKVLMLHEIVGNKTYDTLITSYIRDLPELGMALSLPLGTAPP